MVLFMSPRKFKSRKSKASKTEEAEAPLDELIVDDEPSKPREVKQVVKKCKVCGDMMSIAAKAKKCLSCGGKLYPVEGASDA